MVPSARISACLYYVSVLSVIGWSSTPLNRLPQDKQARMWQIAFHRGHDVWVANGDGTHQHLLVKNGEHPAWSPDKTKLAFARGNAVWTVWADGTHVHRVAEWDGPADSGDTGWWGGVGITWCPDAPYLVYSHELPYKISPPNAGILMCSAIDSAWLWLPDQLTPRSGGRSNAFIEPTSVLEQNSFPVFDRSGKHIAFACNGDVWVATRQPDDPDVDPGVPRSFRTLHEWDSARLAPVAVYQRRTIGADKYEVGVTHLCWSPDGKKLVYALERIGGSGTWEIHSLSLRPDPDREFRVESDREVAEGLQPAFSPDGREIAFLGQGPDNKFESIMVLGPNPATPPQLFIAHAEEPAW